MSYRIDTRLPFHTIREEPVVRATTVPPANGSSWSGCGG